MHLFLVRHGAAGSRHKWDGPDRLRPLSVKGRRQAKELVAAIGSDLEARGPSAGPFTRVLSSPYLRCVQTVEPMAGEAGLKVEKVRALAEGPKPRETMALVRGLHEPGVLCSHGDVIPLVLETLARDDGLVLPSTYPCQKGSAWHLFGKDGRYVEAHYIPPPA